MSGLTWVWLYWVIGLAFGVPIALATIVMLGVLLFARYLRRAAYGDGQGLRPNIGSS